jgi:hypothetical protein
VRAVSRVREIAGASREQSEKTFFGIRKNHAQRNTLTAESRCGQRDQKTLDRYLAGGELGKPGIDHVSSGEAECLDARGSESLPNPARRRGPPCDGRSRFVSHPSRPRPAARAAAAPESLADLDRQFHG